MRMTMAAFSILTLAACGGGGGGSATTGTTDGGPSGPNPGPEPTQIQTLTGAGAPAETLAAQSARAPGILARTDSLIASSMYGDTASSTLPTFRNGAFVKRGILAERRRATSQLAAACTPVVRPGARYELIFRR